MKNSILLGTVASISVLLAGCGGGSSTTSSTTATPPATQTASKISGTAATGAPFAGATVTIIDKTGAQVGTGTTNPDGSYTITLSTGAVAPFVIRAERDDMTLVSVAPDAATTTANITPITNLIAARLSTSGDPVKLAEELKANPDVLAPVNVSARVDEVIALLKPLLDAVGSTVNPLSGQFAADGAGTDRALDSLSIIITPDSATTSHVEVSIKQVATEGEAAPAIQFSAGTNAVAKPSALPTIDATKLLDSGTAPLIAELMARITNCHKLPTADRVDTPNNVAATASAIKASACKTLFKDDNPVAYKNNGRAVGGNSSQNDFFSIFHDGGTNAVFDRGVYEFSRANGDLVVSLRVTTADGEPQERSLVAAEVTVDGKPQLRITGNNYGYEGGVVAYQQLRTFLNKPEADYYSTGYTFSVPNNGLFEKVVVTSPKGNPIVLVPNLGSSFMSIEIGGAPSGTNFLRLGRQYVNGSVKDPKAMDTTMAFSATPWTDTELAAVPQHGVWKFEYYLASAPGAVAATQYYRTRARALSIAEFKLQPLAKLTDTVISEIKAESASTNFIAMAGATTIELDWTVPTGALAPFNIAGFGRFGGVAFDDSLNVKPSARTVAVPCTNQGGADVHCVSGVYAAGANLNSAHLRARDAFGRDYTQFYAFYRPLIP